MKKDKEWLKDSFDKLDNLPVLGNSDYHIGMYDAFVMFDDLIDQLDEPEKVVVPHFVADWFEENMHMFELTMIQLNTNVFKSVEKGSEEFLTWANNVNNKSVETLFKMKNGYTIEEEKWYRLSLKNNLALKVLICWNTKEEKWEPYENETFVGDWNKKAIFTESDLSKIDETSFVRIEVKK